MLKKPVVDVGQGWLEDAYIEAKQLEIEMANNTYAFFVEYDDGTIVLHEELTKQEARRMDASYSSRPPFLVVKWGWLDYSNNPLSYQLLRKQAFQTS